MSPTAMQHTKRAFLEIEGKEDGRYVQDHKYHLLELKDSLVKRG